MAADLQQQLQRYQLWTWRPTEATMRTAPYAGMGVGPNRVGPVYEVESAATIQN